MPEEVIPAGGTHVMVDLFGADDPGEESIDLLRGIAGIAGLEVLESTEHVFPGGGRTAVCLLGASHVTIHTWPEYRHAAVDLFSCREISDSAIGEIENELVRATGAKAAYTNQKSRGTTSVFEERSPHQEISLVREGQNLALYLDGYYQFRSDVERAYHEPLVSLPLAMAGKTCSVLVMGGGDGLAVREALKYPVECVFLVELDPEMIRLAQTPPVSDLNERSLFDPKVKVMVGDAKECIHVFPDGTFDVIVADFPAATTPELAELYSEEFYATVFPKLAPGGVFVTQVSEEPTVLRDIRERVGGMLGHSLSLVAMPNRTSLEAFVYGSRDPLSFKRAPLGTVAPEMGRLIEGAISARKKVVTYKRRRNQNGH